MTRPTGPSLFDSAMMLVIVCAFTALMALLATGVLPH